MPFLEDIGPREERRGPTWEAFAALTDQVERLVAVNIGWSLQLVPGLLALGFPEWPGWLRIVLGVYSATALAPATAVLYGLVEHAAHRQHVDLELARDMVLRLAAPGIRTLAPLYGTFGLLIWGAFLAGVAGLSAIVSLLTLVLLLWSVCATYWGPLLAADPDLSLMAVARRSVWLVWRYPTQSLVTWVVAGLAFLVGVVSIGGLFLVAPVLAGLFQTLRHVDLSAA